MNPSTFPRDPRARLPSSLRVRKNRLISCETGSGRRHSDGWTGRKRKAESGACRPAGGACGRSDAVSVTPVGVAYET